MIIISLLSICGFITINGAFADDLKINLHLPGEDRLTNDDRQAVMITGFWHILEFENFGSENIVIDLVNQNNSLSLYQWVYEDGVWKDEIYDLFLNKEESKSIDDKEYLWISVDPGTEPGIWILNINLDSIEKSQHIEIRPREGGVGLSSPDFFISTPPYVSGIYDTASTNQFGTLSNEAYVPLIVQFSFENENLSISPEITEIPPRETKMFSVVYTACPSRIQKKEIIGEVNVFHKNVGPTLSIVNILPSYNYPFKTTICVGNPDLELIAEDSFSLQYTNSVRINWNETKSLPFIIDSEIPVEVDILGINCTVLSVTNGGHEIVTPFYMDSLNQNYELKITIMPTIKSGVAYLRYIVNGEFYTTMIEVTGEETQVAEIVNDPGIDLTKIFPISILILLSILFIVTRINKARSYVNEKR